MPKLFYFITGTVGGEKAPSYQYIKDHSVSGGEIGAYKKLITYLKI